MKEIPFIGPAYKGRSDNYSSARTINLYLEAGEGKSRGLLIGCPGLTTPWVTLTGGGMRGLYALNENSAIAVCGANVYSLTTAAVPSLIGTVANDSRPVQITDNGTSVCIVSSNLLYSVTVGGSASTYIDSDVSGVDYIDDHFVASRNTSGAFIWSDVGTTTFDPLSTQDTNGSPDILVGIKVARRTMHLFGKKSIEQWYDTGANSDIPFSRIDGAFFEIGCIAKDSIAELDTVFWLGGSSNGAGGVWTIVGGGPKRISTPAVEYAIAQWSDISDAEAFTYTQEGHSFYVLSSNSGGETWVYDISQDEWHQRAWKASNGLLQRIRPRCHMYFAGKNLVGDWENGNIYEYDLDTYSDNGNELVAVRACQIIQEGLENLGNCSLRLDMDTGVGLITGQGSDPQAMLRWSKDGGKTWSSAIWRTIGAIGKFASRVIWHRVGGGDRMVFEVTITDPVKRNITGAFIE